MIVAFGSFVLDGLGLLSAKYFYVVAFVDGLFIYGYLFYCLRGPAGLRRSKFRETSLFLKKFSLSRVAFEKMETKYFVKIRLSFVVIEHFLTLTP